MIYMIFFPSNNVRRYIYNVREFFSLLIALYVIYYIHQTCNDWFPPSEQHTLALYMCTFLVAKSICSEIRFQFSRLVHDLSALWVQKGLPTSVLHNRKLTECVTESNIFQNFNQFLTEIVHKIIRYDKIYPLPPTKKNERKLLRQNKEGLKYLTKLEIIGLCQKQITCSVITKY